MPRLHKEPNRLRLYFLFNYLAVIFLCVVVTKGAQFVQFDWPRKLRSQVSIYNNYRNEYTYSHKVYSGEKFRHVYKIETKINLITGKN